MAALMGAAVIKPRRKRARQARERNMRKVCKRALAVMTAAVLFALPQIAMSQSRFPDGSMVKKTCGACHKPEEKGGLEAIEDTRKTPEEWKVVMIRMERLNQAQVPDEAFHPIVKELSKDLCLTPAEMSKVAYLNSDENSQYREVPKGKLEERMFAACVRCHTFGKIASHRMTESRWAATRDLHLGYYPTTVPQMREMNWLKESQDLIKPLTEMFPFETPQWRQWLKERKDVKLDGQWVVAGYQPGVGYYTGNYTFTANPKKGADEYSITREVVFANGAKVRQEGEGTLYSKYHLRYALAPTQMLGRVEGVFDMDASQKGFSGKWWTVVQDNNAYGNERFYPAKGSPAVVAVYPQALKAGAKNQNVNLVLAGLGQGIKPADIAFSDAQVKVTKLSQGAAGQLICQISVSGKQRQVGLKVKGVAYDAKLVVYDKVDGIKIFPALGRARVSSGAAYPPMGVQYVARALAFGADGKAGTADDLILEPVEAKWTLSEEVTREGDEDLKYLKAPIHGGLYTPVTTYGPIAQRPQKREGVGLIAVNASAKINGKQFKDKALLVVTVPDFITHIK